MTQHGKTSWKIMANILIIDDDEMLCDMLGRHIECSGHKVEYACTLEDGLKAVASKAFDVVFLDVLLPDGNGLNVLPTIRNKKRAPEVIIITGEGEPDGAELAIKTGAWDYIEKPMSIKDITLSLSRALLYREGRGDGETRVMLKRERIVGKSPQLNACLERIGQIAGTHSNILILGETGTGKELFAEVIWENSLRAEKQFVVVDCAALPDTLVESTLFGHTKGAFTGADRSRTGLIKEADGGTLFLDEIGELPLLVQKTFLRVLQEHRFRPVGDDREIESDSRLIAATNRSLEEMVRSGGFRQDLLFRLQSLTVELSPLRSCLQDIKDLTIHYMVKICESYGIETKGFSADFFQTLGNYGWPGNIRELIHSMEHVIANAKFEPTLFPRHLPDKIRIQIARTSVRKKGTDKTSGREGVLTPKKIDTLQSVREAAVSSAEKGYLNALLSYTKKDINEACRISNLSRSRLYHLLKKYQINPS